MPSKGYGNPVQLDLPLYGERTLRACISAYMSYQAESLAEATVVDYQERGAWLLRELGETTLIESIGFDHMDALARRFRGVIRNVTVKRRLVFLRAALKHAQARGQLDRIPALPKLRHDGVAKTTIHTVGQWQAFREFLPPGPFRDIYDLGFWTMHHTSDLFTMQRWMLDPDRPVLDEGGNEVAKGMFLRRNHKNQRCEPCWINMQPEFVLVAKDILNRLGPGQERPIVGRLWNVRRTFHMAADRAAAAGYDIPRISPIDLRRSGASMLAGRAFPVEYVRVVLGHQGEDSHIQGGQTTRPTTATTHYLRPTPALISKGVQAK